ncbi:MAG: YrhA family protein [Alphaproteobacteria bacterium]|nr:YrhA family protein [Alphaproteobacteria bacterium]
MMQDMERIKEQVGCNEPASDAQIKICNIKLKQNNLPELPAEYAEVLKICNGFSNEDVFVFGAEIKNNNRFKDIAEFNIAYFADSQVDWLILGEDDFFYFIYDAEQKKYCIADRDTFDEEYSNADFMMPLEYILRIE